MKEIKILFMFFIFNLAIILLLYKFQIKSLDKNKKAKLLDSKYLDIFPQEIKWNNISEIYYDPYKSATYYTLTDTFIFSVLIPTNKINKIQENKLKIEIKANLYNKLYSAIFDELIHKNDFYSFYIIRFKLNFHNYPFSELFYRLKLQNKLTQFEKVNIVYHKNVTGIARLTKCIFLDDTLDNFKSILFLNLISKYDAIYICNFNDQKVKEILNEHSQINQIMLPKIPNFINNNMEFITGFETLKTYTKDPNTMLDTVSEYLYNLMYPMLIDKHLYVYAADFDQVLVPEKNKSIYSIVKPYENTIQSIYFKQYWYLENKDSLKILKNIQISLNKINHFPFVITNNIFREFNFKISVNNDNELHYAKYILSVMNSLEHISLKCRLVYITFDHPYIYGQTVHHTRSSEIIKLCNERNHFPGGYSTDTTNIHLAHYRNYFNFRLILKNNHLNILQFKYNQNISSLCSYY